MPEKYQYFDEKRFTRDENTGYYLCSTYDSDGKRKRMHVYVWEYYNGKVPDGYHVHHVDGDKSNNEIENLRLEKAFDHMSYHAKQNYKNNPEKYKELLETIRPLTLEWHHSEMGREWHSQHAKQQWENKDPTKYICSFCGKEFYSLKSYPIISNTFCSNNCRTAYRRRSKVDNIRSICIVCGKEFEKNKYSKTQTCSKKCAAKLRIYHRYKVHW